MAYTGPRFNSPYTVNLVGSPAACVGLGTATYNGAGTETASSTTTGNVNGAYVFPKFLRPVVISAIRVFCGTAPGGGVTAIHSIFMLGTNTVGTLDLTGAAVGTFYDATIGSVTVGSNGTWSTGPYASTTGGQLVMLTTYTQTATASTLGSYAVSAEIDELFVT
jgi:hypothetical protein